MTTRPLGLFIVAFLFCTSSFAQREHGQPLNPSTPLNRDTLSGRIGQFASRAIGGSVRGINNHPVADVRVELHATNGEITAVTYSDPAGAFEFRDIPQGSYELVASRGVVQTRERLDLAIGVRTLVVRMPIGAMDDAGNHTSSLSELKVPDNARSELRRARANLAKGNNEAARKNALKAVGMCASYSEAHALLGVIDLSERKAESATTELEQAIRLDQGSAMAYSALGAAYNATGRYADALRALSSAYRLTPNSWQVEFETARAYLGREDFPAALQHASMAAKLAPQQYSAIHLLKGYAFLGVADHPRAIDELEQYVREQPQNDDTPAALRALSLAKTLAHNVE